MKLNYQKAILLIDSFQKNFFEDNHSEMNNYFKDIIDYLIVEVKNDHNFEQVIYPYLVKILHAYENKDFLLVADIMEYDVKSLLNKHRGEAEQC